MTWIAVGAAVVGGATSIYSANKASKDAKKAAVATQTNPYDVNSPFGSVSFEGGQVNANPSPNPFQNFFGSLGLSSLANAGAANSMPFNGANGQLIQQMQAANAASQPGSNEFQDVLAKLRAVSAPQDQRDDVSLDNQLFSRGMLGTSGGAERFRALKEAQMGADNQRQLTAQGIASTNANQRFANALTTVNQGMSNQQQQFNIGANSNTQQQNLFSQLLQQGGLGIAAGGGQAPGAAVYAAQQGSNVPLAVSQIASNPAFSQALQSIFNRPPPAGSTGYNGTQAPPSYSDPNQQG